MNYSTKTWISDLPSYEPGRPIEELARELGLPGIDDIVKLASNENALGPSPRAVEAMRHAASDMHLYPDGSCHYLAEAIAHKHGVDVSQVVLGNGSNEIIELLGHIFLDRDNGLVMSEGAFLIYKLVAMAFQSESAAVPMRSYTHDLDGMLDAIQDDTRLVFIANPNNPTGTMVDGAEIDRFMDQVPGHPLIVFDEAYIELLPVNRRPDTLRYIHDGRNVCILRTFSKAHGLAGLRVGYGLMSGDLANLMHRVRQPFNVNAMAQTAALAALEDESHVENTRRMTEEGLEQMVRAFEDRGLEYVPSVANFILVRVGNGRECYNKFAEQWVIVRPMDAYGFPDHIRVTIGTHDDNEKFIGALDRIMSERDKL